jgi:hypothetical protein
MTALLAPIATAPALLQRWWLQWRAASATRRSTGRSAAEDAAAVRALADTYRRSDPSFASDLYAAADRHESGAGC